MQTFLDSLLTRPIMSIGMGAFLSGVALLYIVVQRTRKHRLEQSRNPEL